MEPAACATLEVMRCRLSHYRQGGNVRGAAAQASCPYEHTTYQDNLAEFAGWCRPGRCSEAGAHLARDLLVSLDGHDAAGIGRKCGVGIVADACHQVELNGLAQQHGVGLDGGIRVVPACSMAAW